MLSVFHYIHKNEIEKGMFEEKIKLHWVRFLAISEFVIIVFYCSACHITYNLSYLNTPGKRKACKYASVWGWHELLYILRIVHNGITVHIDLGEDIMHPVLFAKKTVSLCNLFWVKHIMFTSAFNVNMATFSFVMLVIVLILRSLSFL